VDLSQRIYNRGRPWETTWNEYGSTYEPESDLSQILGRGIASRDEAAKIAKKLLKSEQKAWFWKTLMIM